MNQFPIGLAGIAAIFAVAFLLSTDKRAIRPRVILPAFALQAAIAVLVLYVPAGRQAIETVSRGVSALLGYAKAGTSFLLGPLAEIGAASLAIAALPTIIFFASLVAILYHLKIMPLIIRWLGGAIEKVTGVTKVESLTAAANIFVGQSESPLVVRPYLAALTPSQLFTIMTVGLAGTAGTILAAYATVLGEQYLPFLLAAAFMSAPGGILMAKIIMPDPKVVPSDELPLEDDPKAREEEALREAEVALEEAPAVNVIQAAAEGAQTGVRIAVAVAGMLLAFVALVAMANGILGAIGSWFGYPDLSFQGVLGAILAPAMYLIGVPWEHTSTAGGLYGTKIVLNEFVAFLDLGQITTLPERTRAIVIIALCGFANFSSIAIQIGTTGSLAPNQRPMIAKLGLRALAAGSLANLLSAALASLLLP